MEIALVHNTRNPRRAKVHQCIRGEPRGPAGAARELQSDTREGAKLAKLRRSSAMSAGVLGMMARRCRFKSVRFILSAMGFGEGLAAARCCEHRENLDERLSYLGFGVLECLECQAYRHECANCPMTMLGGDPSGLDLRMSSLEFL